MTLSQFPHHDTITPYLTALHAVLDRVPQHEVDSVVGALYAAYEADHIIYIAGNGGSAANASHFANDLAKATIVPGQPRFRVVAITDSMPVLTAWANDASYADAFAEQLRPLIRPGDVFVAISGSGKSANILRAAEVAHENGATVIGFLGFDGGLLRTLSDWSILVPCDVMAQVEDAHLIIQHAICTYLREVIAHNEDLSVFTAAADG